jgi:hypothetical protein
MAGDLIPPPSPAGRPPPDSMADVRATSYLEEPTHPADDAERAKAGPTPYRGRFGFIWGALAGIAVCVVGLGAFLVASSGSDGPPLAKNWSDWKPSTSRMLTGAEDIAAHVAHEYKLDTGDQLAAIRSGGFEISGTPIGVAVRPKGGELEVLRGPGLLYLLNGLSTDAKTTTGKAGRINERLMMREAVELALYSFRYLDDVTMVAVMLPPRTGPAEAATDGQQSRTIFFRPGDLLARLEVPLSRTMAATPPRPKDVDQQEAAKIDSLALRNLFLASIQPLDSNLSYLVLTPPEVID